MTEGSTHKSQALLSELQDIGFPAASLAALRDSGSRYTNAVPILLRWLPTDDLALKEQIVRALSYPWAKKAALPPLIEEFRTLPLEGELQGKIDSVRWAIGNAIETMWDDSYFDELAAIVSNTAYGRARQMIVLGLRKSKKPEAVSLLLSLLSDEDVSGHATSSLAKLAPPEAVPSLEKMLADKRAWVRKDAKRGLEKIGKHHT